MVASGPRSFSGPFQTASKSLQFLPTRYVRLRRRVAAHNHDLVVHEPGLWIIFSFLRNSLCDMLVHMLTGCLCFASNLTWKRFLLTLSNIKCWRLRLVIRDRLDEIGLFWRTT
jgi:hypothetical protein